MGAEARGEDGRRAERWTGALNFKPDGWQSGEKWLG